MGNRCRRPASLHPLLQLADPGDLRRRNIASDHLDLLPAQKGGIRGGLVACVHDELLLEVHEVDAEYAREILQQTMIDAFVATFPGAPTNGVATAKVGLSWVEVK